MWVFLYLALKTFAVWFCLLGSTEGNDKRSARQMMFPIPVEHYIFPYEDLQVLHPLDGAAMDLQSPDLYRQILPYNQLPQYPFNEIIKKTSRTQQEHQNLQLKSKLKAAEHLFKLFGSKLSIHQEEANVQSQAATVRTLDFNPNTVSVLPAHLQKFFSELRKEVKRREDKSYVPAQPTKRGANSYGDMIKNYPYYDIKQNTHSVLNERYMRSDDLSLEEKGSEEEDDEMKKRIKTLTNEEIKELIIFFHKIKQIYEQVISTTDKVVQYVEGHAKDIAFPDNHSSEELEIENTTMLAIETTSKQDVLIKVQQEPDNISTIMPGTLVTATSFSNAKGYQRITEELPRVFENENIRIINNLSLPKVIKIDDRPHENTEFLTPAYTNKPIEGNEHPGKHSKPNNDNIDTKQLITSNNAEDPTTAITSTQYTTHSPKTTLEPIKTTMGAEIINKQLNNDMDLSTKSSVEVPTSLTTFPAKALHITLSSIANNVMDYNKTFDEISLNNSRAYLTSVGDSNYNLLQSTTEDTRLPVQIYNQNFYKEEHFKLFSDNNDTATNTLEMSTWIKIEPENSSTEIVTTIKSNQNEEYFEQHSGSNDTIMDTFESTTWTNPELENSTTELVTKIKSNENEEYLKLQSDNNDTTMDTLKIITLTSPELENSTTEIVRISSKENITHSFEGISEEEIPRVE